MNMLTHPVLVTWWPDMLAVVAKPPKEALGLFAKKCAWGQAVNWYTDMIQTRKYISCFLGAGGQSYLEAMR